MKHFAHLHFKKWFVHFHTRFFSPHLYGAPNGDVGKLFLKVKLTIFSSFFPQDCTMSLSQNGTLEKTMSEQTQSELRTASRAGSGVVVPPPYSLGGSEAADTPLELRGSLDCWACSVLVTAQNLVITLINVGLASIVFGTILTPALVMIIFGFLCHSTVSYSVQSFSIHGFTEYKKGMSRCVNCTAALECHWHTKGMENVFTKI